MNSKRAGNIMIQGTASSVGKSLICTGLCRVFKQDGYRVAPFKSQNMALNSYITKDGLEMGRAQAMQAEAAGVEPSVEMNPILLKPTADANAQVIINGVAQGNMSAVKYHYSKPKLAAMLKDIYEGLAKKYDIIVLEGAGSPAEINLRDRDIVNMGMAEIANAPVVIVGDIDKGGVFASLAGTMLLLTEEERARVKGVIINKFRGDINLLKPGLKMLEDIIKVPVLGVLPYIKLNLDDEDGHLDERFARRYSDGKSDIDIAVVRLPHISNYTDFSALENIPSVSVRYVDSPDQFSRPDMIILPGTSNTIGDLLAIRSAGIEQHIKKLNSKGIPVFGICGGYQMLGKEIEDPDRIESPEPLVKGMGLLDMKIIYRKEKIATQVQAVVTDGSGFFEGLENMVVNGYEIHMGVNEFLGNCFPFLSVKEMSGESSSKIGGVRNKEGNVFGTYIHGLFNKDEFALGFINNLRKRKGLKPLDQNWRSYKDFIEEEYDRLAEMIRANLNMKAIYDIVNSQNLRG